MDCTKENPGYYSDMLNALAEIDGVESTKKITFNSMQSARKGNRNTWCPYTQMIFTIDGKEIMCVKVEVKIGSIQTLIFGSFEMPLSEYTGKVSRIVRKSLKEYSTQPQLLKQPYKYCEGGGWYSNASLYLLNGKYYTNAY